MIIDCVLHPAEIALLSRRDLSASTCVVFDVLRATSSMITALAHGAADIHPVVSIEEALALKEKLPHAILGGERGGERIAGFDLGNSPQEYLGLSGRTIITTTTNGTVALRACGQAGRVLAGALLNLDALAAAVRRQPPAHLLLVCAGTFEECALEDMYAAGRLIQLLPGETLTDAARAALAIAQAYAEPLAALRQARNGQALVEKSRETDVEWCARLSAYNIVGLQQASVLRALST